MKDFPSIQQQLSVAQWRECWTTDHGVPGSNLSGVPFHILHFVSDIYFLVSKILSPMWNLEMGEAKEHAPCLTSSVFKTSDDIYSVILTNSRNKNYSQEAW